MGEEQPGSISPETANPVTPSSESPLPNSSESVQSVPSVKPDEEPITTSLVGVDSQEGENEETGGQPVEEVSAERDEPIKAETAPKTPADIIIEREIEAAKAEKTRLEGELAGLSGKELADKKQQIADQIKLMGALELAAAAKGELGVFFKAKALKALYDIKGVDKVDGLYQTMAIVRNECRQQLENLTYHIRVNNRNISREQLQELINDPEQGLEKLMTGGAFEISGNLQQLFFGQKMTPEKQAELLSGANLTPEQINFLKKHGKEAKGGLLILLLLGLLGAKNAFTDLTMPQRMAA